MVRMSLTARLLLSTGKLNEVSLVQRIPPLSVDDNGVFTQLVSARVPVEGNVRRLKEAQLHIDDLALRYSAIVLRVRVEGARDEHESAGARKRTCDHWHDELDDTKGGAIFLQVQVRKKDQ